MKLNLLNYSISLFLFPLVISIPAHFGLIRVFQEFILSIMSSLQQVFLCGKPEFRKLSVTRSCRKGSYIFIFIIIIIILLKKVLGNYPIRLELLPELSKPPAPGWPEATSGWSVREGCDGLCLVLMVAIPPKGSVLNIAIPLLVYQFLGRILGTWVNWVKGIYLTLFIYLYILGVYIIWSIKKLKYRGTWNEET